MICVVQKVLDASVTVDDRIVGSIDDGLLIYFGVATGDAEDKVDRIVDKICRERIFEDENGKMNLSLNDVKKQVLVVSQFTLCADLNKGNRPSFDTAERPDKANVLYEKALRLFRERGFHTQGGQFGAHMMVRYTNDGPETFIFEK